MPLARDVPELRKQRLVFIDDSAGASASVNGQEALTFAEFLTQPAEAKRVAVAVAQPRVRFEIVQQLDAASIPLLSIWSMNHVIMDDVVVGEGALISPFVTFTSNIRVGRCFHANLYSYVEHDCVIGDYVTFAPGAKCNGNVTIGNFAYIGSGAVIRQGLNIGAGAVVGMGAVVTKDVPPGTTVVGNPARPLVKA